jgi:hypothetical protein
VQCCSVSMPSCMWFVALLPHSARLCFWQSAVANSAVSAARCCIKPTEAELCGAAPCPVLCAAVLQMGALRAGLDGTPLVLIQGPPGTGGCTELVIWAGVGEWYGRGNECLVMCWPADVVCCCCLCHTACGSFFRPSLSFMSSPSPLSPRAPCLPSPPPPTQARRAPFSTPSQW